MLIYDIGANKGAFTSANMLIYKDANFVLVEANPYLCDLLNQTFRSNKNITILNKCLHNVDDVDVEFFINNECNQISTASKKWIEQCRFAKDFKNINKIKISSISIDSLVSLYGKPDYIKIDVEGYENVVIGGMKKYNGLLSFEWAEEMKDEIIQSLTKLNSIGYEYFFLSYEDNYSFLPNENSYINYSEMLDLINVNLNGNSNYKWGMIFAK